MEMINFNNSGLEDLNLEEIENVNGGESGWYYLGKICRAIFDTEVVPLPCGG